MLLRLRLVLILQRRDFRLIPLADVNAPAWTTTGLIGGKKATAGEPERLCSGALHSRLEADGRRFGVWGQERRRDFGTRWQIQKADITGLQQH